MLFKKILPLSSLLFFFFNHSANARQDTLPAENWDTYLAQYEKSAGSVMINMALKNVAPIKAYPFVVITGVTFKDCPTDGFPSKREFKNLYQISDSVKTIIEKSTASIITGSFTYQCERLDYYYVTDTTWLRQRLTNMYKTRFPNYTPYINIKADRNWSGYLDFLYPNEETLDYMGNQKVIMALQNAGDKLVKPRSVDHWAYFKTENDRNCFVSYLTKNKFTVTSKDSNGKAPFSLSLHFSRIDKVDLSSISKVTLELGRQASQCNGDYDGWETVVLK
jgi:Family of unknown function (DUF695)/Regulator of ribonuclease activity B